MQYKPRLRYLMVKRLLHYRTRSMKGGSMSYTVPGRGIFSPLWPNQSACSCASDEISTSMNVIYEGCPFTKKASLGKWYWHWSIDPTWLILRKKINRVPSRFESAMTWGQRCSRPEKPTDPWRTTHCYLIDRRGHLKKRSLITWRSENSVKPVARRFAARVFSLVFTPSSLVWDTIVVNVVSYFTLPLVGSAVRGR